MNLHEEETYPSSCLVKRNIILTISEAYRVLKFTNKTYEEKAKEFYIYKLNDTLNKLKSIEFEINNYPKKEYFYKAKHLIETKLNLIL